jgi:flagellar hook assembly protein FlgD
VDDGPGAFPPEYRLHPNVPNPFNPSTSIRYEVPAGGGWVSIIVYDVEGRRVRTLVDGLQPGGTQSVSWDGRDSAGRRVASGIYFYRMTAENFQHTRKMALLE